MGRKHCWLMRLTVNQDNRDRPPAGPRLFMAQIGVVFQEEITMSTDPEVLAIIGNSGEQTTGTHLHFELWYNGTAVNPEDYISF